MLRRRGKVPVVSAPEDEDYIKALDYDELERRFDIHKYYPKFIHNYDYLTPQIRELICDKPIYAKANEHVRGFKNAGVRKTFVTEIDVETGQIQVREKKSREEAKREKREKREKRGKRQERKERKDAKRRTDTNTDKPLDTDTKSETKSDTNTNTTININTNIINNINTGRAGVQNINTRQQSEIAAHQPCGVRDACTAGAHTRIAAHDAQVSAVHDASDCSGRKDKSHRSEPRLNEPHSELPRNGANSGRPENSGAQRVTQTERDSTESNHSDSSRAAARRLLREYKSQRASEKTTQPYVAPAIRPPGQPALGDGPASEKHNAEKQTNTNGNINTNGSTNINGSANADGIHGNGHISGNGDVNGHGFNTNGKFSHALAPKASGSSATLVASHEAPPPDGVRSRQNSVCTVGSVGSTSLRATLSGRLRHMMRRRESSGDGLVRTASYDQTLLVMTTARGAKNKLLRLKEDSGRRMSAQFGTYIERE